MPDDNTTDMVSYLKKKNEELEKKLDFTIWYFVEKKIYESPNISEEYTRELFESLIGNKKE